MGTGITLQKEDYIKEEATFPSQELPCSGSTGLISANLLLRPQTTNSAPRGIISLQMYTIKKLKNAVTFFISVR